MAAKTVILVTGDRGKAAVKKLQTRNLLGSVEVLPTYVTNDDTSERAATTVQRDHGKLGILVNNAGIGSVTPPLRRQMREAFNTNAIGSAVETIAFALLQKSSASPRIVNIRSGVGSISRRLNPSSPAIKFSRYTGIKVFAYDPGFTQSNLGPHNKAENGAKPASEAVMPLIDVLEGRRDDDVGKFLHNIGVYPW
ncbi:MAG: hypothetical protein M1818_005959 [Claussenomyces sp. TS43310]|nr:MAG: hypothetical protein M1818_005959 [Claussenomyces sp. TS43310]